MPTPLQNAMSYLTSATNEIVQGIRDAQESGEMSNIPQLQRMNDEIRMIQTRILSFMARGNRTPPAKPS